MTGKVPCAWEPLSSSLPPSAAHPRPWLRPPEDPTVLVTECVRCSAWSALPVRGSSQSPLPSLRRMSSGDTGSYTVVARVACHSSEVSAPRTGLGTRRVITKCLMSDGILSLPQSSVKAGAFLGEINVKQSEDAQDRDVGSRGPTGREETQQPEPRFALTCCLRTKEAQGREQFCSFRDPSGTARMPVHSHGR